MARVKKGLNAHKRHKKVLKMAKGSFRICWKKEQEERI